MRQSGVRRTLHKEEEGAEDGIKKWQPTHISILSSSKVLLGPLNTAETPTELVDTLLETTSLLSQRNWLGGRDRPWFALDHNIKVDEFLREGRHVVGEAKGVLSGEMSGEDVIPLTFAFSFDDNRV